MGASLSPNETDPPLIVDADAVLSSPVAPELLKAVARRDPQVLGIGCGMDNLKLAEHGALDPTVQ